MFAIIGVVAVGLVISYYYSLEQTRIQGFNFGSNLREIQDELKNLQTNFDSKYTIWKEGDITKEEFLQFSRSHIEKMEGLASRYQTLSPPDGFASSVELFELSTRSQIESDKQTIEWIKTGDQSAKIRSEVLLQEAFEYELAALEKFNAAKKGSNP